MKPDAAWFNAKIRSRFQNQRAFAPKMKDRHGRPLDQPKLSRMLRGERAMQLHEARQFAELLGVPLIEVLERAGLRSRASERTLSLPQDIFEWAKKEAGEKYREFLLEKLRKLTGIAGRRDSERRRSS
jgi:hypothetical protein